MKINYDKNGRKLYKLSHSICQGDFLYSHKTKEGELIKNKENLKNLLNAIAKKLGSIDVRIKIYKNAFFLFYMHKPSINSQQIIEGIQQNISQFALCEKEYLIMGANDLQEKYVKEEPEKRGFNYDKG